MSKAQQTLAQAFLERISRGAVPMGGFYSVDPKALRSQSTGAEATAEAMAPNARRTSAAARRASAAGRFSAMAARANATGQPATAARQPGAMASQSSAIAWRPVALAQRIWLAAIGRLRKSVSTGCTPHAPGERS